MNNCTAVTPATRSNYLNTPATKAMDKDTNAQAI